MDKMIMRMVVQPIGLLNKPLSMNKDKTGTTKYAKRARTAWEEFKALQKRTRNVIDQRKTLKRE